MVSNLTDVTSLEFRNTSFNSSESYSREVVFGPPSDDIVILIERNPGSGEYVVSVGNGPFHTDAPEIVADILVEVAGYLTELATDEDYITEAKNYEN